MAQRLSKLKSENPTKQLSLTKQKLSTEKRVLSPEKQKQLNGMLIEAANKGKIKRVERLLKIGANINAKDNLGRSALIKAAKEGHTETCALLIEKRHILTKVTMIARLRSWKLPKEGT